MNIIISKAFIRFCFVALTLTLCFRPGFAVVLDVNAMGDHTEYLGVTGTVRRQAPFRMLVPHAWNGKLLVYARGTASAIFSELVGGQLLPILDPSSGLPILGVTPLVNIPGATAGDNTAALTLEQALIDQGYALIASEYKPDPRFIEEGKLTWVVEDGFTDTLAVTRQARSVLKHIYGQWPQRTLLWGRSQGSLVALKLNEQRPRLYQGVLTGCTIGAGAARTWDIGIGFALAFDVAFAQQGGWNETLWGSVGGGDIPQDLDFAADVAPTVGALLQNPLNFGLFEFIRLVNDLPLEAFYPLATDPTAFNWLFTDMLFLTEVRGDLESEAKADGRVGQNLNHHYSLSAEEQAYLATLGVPVSDLLDEMNARTTIEANRRARRYADQFYGLTGKLKRPVISLHTTVDGLVIPSAESALLDLVTQQRKQRKLLQVFTDGVGHCAFTPAQWLDSIAAMEFWLDTGDKPDTSFFSADGFDLDYIPAPWPQPL